MCTRISTLLLAALFAPPTAQTLFSLPTLAQVADGVIEGSVRDILSGRPIAGATLTLIAPGGGRTQSDAAGLFRFKGLSPGNYAVIVRKLGYVDSSYREGRSGQVTVKSGAPVTLTIDLTPTGALEGRVIGEGGKPLFGATAYVGRSIVTAIPADTDADGHFRVENLAPGEHRVQVRLPFDTRRDTARRDPEHGEIWAYPAATAAPLAAHVPPGVTVSGFEVQLRRTRVAGVTGRLIDAAGDSPLSTAHVELSGTNSANDGPFTSRSVGPDGRFELPLVEPGQYRLLVYYEGQRNRWPYVLSLDVATRAAEEQTFRVPAAVRVEGRVVRPGHPADPPLNLTVKIAPSRFSTRVREVKPSPDGAFELGDLPPGDYLVAALWTGDHPPGWYVDKVRFGEQDGVAGSLRIGEAGNPPLEIVLGENGGRIAGRIPAGKDRTRPGALQLLRMVPGMRPNLAALSSMTVAARPDGSFSVEDLAPGEYSVQPVGCMKSIRVRVERGVNSTVQIEDCP